MRSWLRRLLNVRPQELRVTLPDDKVWLRPVIREGVLVLRWFDRED